jgi:SAM-dependent methyltransferase
MAILGGRIAYGFLKRFYPNGTGVPMPQTDPFAERGISKLKTYFGPDIFDDMKGKSVLDFGCGAGSNALEMAAAGCQQVIGLDIQEPLLELARRSARDRGLHDHVKFVSSWHEPVDVVISTDAFEHFDDPAGVLKTMRSLLKPSGYVLTAFGPTWLHPYGGHLFSVFPWAHMLFTERALIRWRSDFKTDGATCFSECAGGLNQMTISRWERVVADSPFRYESYRLVPIRVVRHLHNRLTREFFTSIVVAKLRIRAAS